MFLGYNLLSKQDFFSNIKEISSVFWTKIISNIFYFINLNKFWLSINFLLFLQLFFEFIYLKKNDSKVIYNYNVKKHYNTLLMILPLFLNINNKLTNFINLSFSKNTYMQHQLVLKAGSAKTEISLF
jgi:hypothetical protein